MNIRDIDLHLAAYCKMYPLATAPELLTYYRFCLEKYRQINQYNLHMVVRDLEKQITKLKMDLDDAAEDVHVLMRRLEAANKQESHVLFVGPIDIGEDKWHRATLRLTDKLVTFWTNCPQNKLHELMPELSDWVINYKNKDRHLRNDRIEEILKSRSITFLNLKGFKAKLYKPSIAKS